MTCGREGICSYETAEDGRSINLVNNWEGIEITKAPNETSWSQLLLKGFVGHLLKRSLESTSSLLGLEKGSRKMARTQSFHKANGGTVFLKTCCETQTKTTNDLPAKKEDQT